MRNNYIFVCLTIVFLAVPYSCFAQIHKSKNAEQTSVENESQKQRVLNSYTLNPIVVTGSGHHQRLKSTATPVHVISRKDITEQGISTFEAALTRMMPQVSMTPNSMGSFLRLNGLGNKYILILVNGQKIAGDVSGNIDLSRINMSRVRRIEVLDGAASSLYGSDAIAGVINIITDQPTSQMLSISSDTRISGKGQLTEDINIDIYNNGVGSYTTITHDRADSYQNNNREYVKGSDTETQLTLAPYFTGYRADKLSQKFTFEPMKKLAMNTSIDYSQKITDRPNTNPDIAGGTDYEMKHKGLRLQAGGIYKFSEKNSLQASIIADRYRYGKLYDVATKQQNIGDYVQSKKQRAIEGELKAILSLFDNSTTIVGANWQNNFMRATSGNIDETIYSVATYLQHEQTIAKTITATAGLRLTHNQTFGNHLSPKLTLMWAPNNIRLRATYSSGFRAPGLDELFYHYFALNRGTPHIAFGNKDLSPEKSHYIAINSEFHTNRCYIGITAFYNRINDMIARKDIAVDTQTAEMLKREFPEMSTDQADKLVRYSRYQNNDCGEVKGIQINASALLLNHFEFSANYACTYARTKSDDMWHVLDRSIRNSATISLNYSRSWSNYKLNINLSGRFQSKTYYQAYEDAPGFGVVNLQTTHTFNCCQWATIVPSIGVDNIFNKVDNRIDSPLRRYALFSPGRMITAGLKIKLFK